MSMSETHASARESDAATPLAHRDCLLAGAWRLVSWDARTSEGSVSYPFGERVVGSLIYTADGHMSAQVMRLGRPRFAGGDILRGTTEENMAAIQGYIAYGGSYRIQDGVVYHQVEMSLYPNWIGDEQPRMIAWAGERLILSTAPILTSGGMLVHRLTWERVSPASRA